MLRRLAALALWTYFAWYLGALLANALDLSSALGPALGFAMLALAVYDWRGRRPLSRSATAGMRSNA